MTTNELTELVQKKLQEKFADGLVKTEIHYDFPVFIVQKAIIHDALRFLKEDETLAFSFLTTLCALHTPDNEGAEFSMMYQMHNLSQNWRIRLRTFMPKENLEIPTVSDIFPTANWMERQEYDFFGIQFKGHPDLRRILNMDEMNYFPLRKEFPLEDATRHDKEDSFFGR